VLAVVIRAEGSLARLRAVAGAELRLGFRHSIYGSWVEEIFRVVAGGLRLARLRYAEPRLVEFYGHESARPEGAWLVVEADGRLHESLTVRVSRASAMRLAVGAATVALTERVGDGAAVRVTVVPWEEERP
jgi:hypothetical protein